MSGLYLLGIAVGILAAFLYKGTLFCGEPVPFVMELPNYRLPGIKNVLQLLWEKAKDFLQKAFTVIFLAGCFVPLFRPLGMGDWRICTALISGFIAKESVASTLGVLFGGNVGAALSGTTAASMLVFSLLYTPCVAAIASIKRELGAKWAAGVALWQCAIAWVAAWVVHLIGMLL